MTTGINTDHFTAQGAEHAVCQDYALSGVLESGGDAMGWAVVCDGCSSSPETDWGARLVAEGVRPRLPSLPASLSDGGGPSYTPERWFGDIGGTALSRAAEQADLLGLPRKCLDTTLLFAHTAHGAVWVAAYGDGLVARRRRSTGAWEVSEISYGANYPDYLTYQFDADRRTQWEAVPDNDKNVITRLLCCTGTTNCVAPGERLLPSYPATFWRFPSSDFDCVMLLSDGAGSFRTPSGEEAGGRFLAGLTDFKGMAGAFLWRRWKRLQKEARESGLWHYDDLAAAAIHIAEER
jgi:hypothetical protein